MGTQSASKATRDGGAERCAAPAVHKSLAGDLALIPSDDALLRDVKLPIGNTATPHAAQTLSLRHTVPGIGTSLSLVRRYDMQDSARFPRGQDVAASCRRVTCAKAAAGKRSGTSGSHIGHAPRTWAFAEAAVFCVREKPAAQTCRARVAHTHRTGHAVTILAHPWARAVSSMFKRQTAFALDTCLRGEGRGAGEFHAALDRPGMHLIHNAH